MWYNRNIPKWSLTKGGIFMAKGKPNKRYTPEFKIKVVETMHNEELSYREAARNLRLRITIWYGRVCQGRETVWTTPVQRIFSAYWKQSFYIYRSLTLLNISSQSLRLILNGTIQSESNLNSMECHLLNTVLPKLHNATKRPSFVALSLCINFLLNLCLTFWGQFRPPPINS